MQRDIPTVSPSYQNTCIRHCRFHRITDQSTPSIAALSDAERNGNSRREEEGGGDKWLLWAETNGFFWMPGTSNLSAAGMMLNLERRGNPEE